MAYNFSNDEFTYAEHVQASTSITLVTAIHEVDAGTKEQQIAK